MENQERMEEVEIDLLEVFHALTRKWWAIVMSLIIGACLAGGATQLMVTPQYEASSMIYILSNTTSISSALDIQLGKQLTVDFETLATSRPVIEAVIDKLDLDANYKQLRNIITVQNPSETQILKITCTNPDPILARDIANAMADATAARVAEVMVTDKPSTVEQAVVPEEPSSPRLAKNVAIGALLAALLAMGVITLQVILDDTIKKEDDVMKYLELNTLAAIPVDNAMANKRSAGRKRAVKA